MLQELGIIHGVCTEAIGMWCLRRHAGDLPLSQTIFLFCTIGVCSTSKETTDQADPWPTSHGQHRMLQMDKRASRGAQLCFTSVCSHDVEGIHDVGHLDLTDPYACGC